MPSKPPVLSVTPLKSASINAVPEILLLQSKVTSILAASTETLAVAIAESSTARLSVRIPVVGVAARFWYFIACNKVVACVAERAPPSAF